ncbi:MAG: carboxypeptidase-like regulatory domain-containing protein [Planctomycetota bacterium]
MNGRETTARDKAVEVRQRRRLAWIMALVLLLLWQAIRSDDGPPEVVPDEVAPPLVQAPEQNSNAIAEWTEPSETTVRTDTTPAAARREPADLVLPYAFTLHVQVLDLYSLPVPDARVFVAPTRCALALWPEPTDGSGKVTIQCQGRRSELSVFVSVLAYGIAEPLRLVTLKSDVATTCSIVSRGRAHEPTALLQMIERDGGDVAQAVARASERKMLFESNQKRMDVRQGSVRRRDEYDTLCGRTLTLFTFIECTFCHEPSLAQSYAPFGSARSMKPHDSSAPIFADLAVANDGTAMGDTEDKPSPPARKRGTRKVVNELETALTREFGSTRIGSVTGIVRNEAGAPQPGVQVVWQATTGLVRNRAETDAEGRYRIGLPTTGACTLLACSIGLGRDQALVAAVPMGVVHQDFDLRATSFVRGTASDETGAPLQGARVEFHSDVEDGTGLAVTGSDGSFALAQLPRSGRCLLWPVDQDMHLPVFLSDSVLPDAQGVALRLPKEPPQRARLRVLPKLPLGREHSRVCIRVLQLDSGRATQLQGSSIAGGFQLEGLMAGPYRIELGAEGLGWVTLSPLHLDGRGLWNLGAVEWPSPGTLRFLDSDSAIPVRARAIEFRLQRDDTDLLTDPFWLGADSVSLPAGEYAVIWHTATGEQKTAAITVEVGGNHELSLAP